MLKPIKTQNYHCRFLTIKSASLAKGRGKFSLVLDTHGSKRTQKQYRNPDGSDPLEDLNRQFKEAVKKSPGRREELVEVFKKHVLERKLQIERELELTPRPVFSNDNVTVAEEYFDSVLSYRSQRDKYSVKQGLHRAIKALGIVPLRSASRHELQKAISSLQPSVHNKVAAQINSILKYLKRDIVLQNVRIPATIPANIHKDELPKILKYVEDPRLRLVYQMLFYSGMRVGELFAVEPSHISPASRDQSAVLTIGKQILDKHTTKLRGLKSQVDVTKTSRIRRVAVPSAFTDAASEWFKIPAAERLSLREMDHGGLFKEACMKAFPDQPDKHLTARDLRHCFAIACLQTGLSMGFVALQLGNSEAVCRRYYLGFAATDETLEVIRRYMKL